MSSPDVFAKFRYRTTEQLEELSTHPDLAVQERIAIQEILQSRAEAVTRRAGSRGGTPAAVEGRQQERHSRGGQREWVWRTLGGALLTVGLYQLLAPAAAPASSVGGGMPLADLLKRLILGQTFTTVGALFILAGWWPRR